MLRRSISRFAASASKKPTTAAAQVPSNHTDSFVQGLFTNQLVTDHVFPYPNVLDEDRLENLSMVVESTQAFFDDVNDADKNDELKEIGKEAWEGAKELGAFGLLVPEEYGGMAMNNTEYARL